MRMNKPFYLLLITLLYSCTYDSLQDNSVPDSGYPEQISNIIVNKCATQGCHNSQSRNSASGLDFTTWDLMFEGGRNGTSVIPYSAANSFMMYAVNTDTNRGPVLLPTMPYQSQPLSDAEYQTLNDWIANGAPNNKNFVKFSDNPNRKKAYICIQGCDKVAVIDAETKVIMRYINVGINPTAIEAPHQVRVSPDGNYWYAVFVAGEVLQKFRTSDDALVATLDLGQGVANWNTIIITPDGTKGFVNDPNNSKTAVVNLTTMTLEWVKSFESPHGGFITPDGHYLYLTAQIGNFINKIDLTTDPFYDSEYIVLVPGQQHSTSSSLNPHEAILSVDGSKYYVSCQATNEVRVFQTSNDSLITVIPVGTLPQEFDVSTTHPYVFVTCTEAAAGSGKKGLVYVIDANTNAIVTSIYTGYQPHGIAVSDAENLVYVANLNYDPNGPAPHHVSSCGNRNGYLTIIDMSTLQLFNKTQSDGVSYQYKNELLSFPYFVSIRK